MAAGIQKTVSQGAAVEWESEYQAVIVYGRRVNHLLHFIVGIFTLGLWWLVWIVLAIFGGEKRWLISVDESGKATWTKAKRR